MSTVNFSASMPSSAAQMARSSGRGELRHHRDTRDIDAPVRHAAIREPERDFVAGHAVSVHVVVHPQRVHVEVRDLHPDRRQLLSRGALPRQQFGGQEMRAQDGIRREARDFGVQLAGVELLGGALELSDDGVARGPVARGQYRYDQSCGSFSTSLMYDSPYSLRKSRETRVSRSRCVARTCGLATRAAAQMASAARTWPAPAETLRTRMWDVMALDLIVPRPLRPLSFARDGTHSHTRGLHAL